jgi:hypothetical protein
MHTYRLSISSASENHGKQGADLHLTLTQSLRYLLIVICLSVASIQTAASQTSSIDEQAATLAQAESALHTGEKQLSRIGNLQFSLEEQSGEIYALDQHKATEPIYLELKNPPKNLIANYRFQGDNNLHPLAKDGTSLRVPIPSDIDMVVVVLAWCNRGCALATTTQAPPYTCQQSTSSSTQNTSTTPQGGNANTEKQVASDQTTSTAVTAGEECQETVVFLRELTVPDGKLKGTLLPAFIFSTSGLEISEALLEANPRRVLRMS